MYNNTNPAELYSGTTWELLTAGKYIQSGSTPLSTGGSNSITISKANLPNIKLKVDSFSLTTQPHIHYLHVVTDSNGSGANGQNAAVSCGSDKGREVDLATSNYAISNGGENTGTASPYTETLGSGTVLSIQPAYITLKFWKRLT